MISRFLLLFLLLADGCASHYTSGEVTNVADGDTFSLLLGHDELQRVRLYGVDCPERGQPFNRVATAYTKELLAMGEVSVKEMSIDQYGRVVGIVYVADTINVNERLLQAGLAWHYSSYDNNPIWKAMEMEAKSMKKGLWAEKGAVPPWEWRKKKRNPKTPLHNHLFEASPSIR